VNQFADWLARTPLSLAIQTHEWVIPTVQSIHIILIGVVLGSVLMINLRILRWAGRDQTLAQTTARFFPWLSWALLALFVTGLTMVVGEPARELLAFSFWVKLALVAIGTIVALAFRRSLRRHETRWETGLLDQARVRAFAVFTLLVWIGVVVLGRLIAYDHVWGAWSAALKD
jgi:hypothetical protein